MMSSLFRLSAVMAASGLAWDPTSPPPWRDSLWCGFMSWPLDARLGGSLDIVFRHQHEGGEGVRVSWSRMPLSL
jgi:hypothetical protein